MRLSLPSSILLGSVVIALGLYLGLRARAPSGGAPAAVPTGVAQPPGSGGALSPGGATVPPPRPMPSDEQLRAEVVAQVEGARSRWTAACWDTADPATREPGRYVSVLAFDAEGGLDVSGITELRGASDPGVAQCLRLQVSPFTISAPGRHVTFEVPFELP